MQMSGISTLRRVATALLAAAVLALPAQAARIDAYEFDDPQQAATYKKLIEELRCLVCQNQNLADSNAELALDLRRKTYEMVSTGKSEDEIVDYMVQRYGDFVLYRPRLTGTTLLLWGGPFVILLLGVAILLRMIRRRRSSAPAVLSADERTRAEQLLGKQE